MQTEGLEGFAHGHAYGATGAIETILALEAVRRGQALPTINLTDPDPE